MSNLIALIKKILYTSFWKVLILITYSTASGILLINIFKAQDYQTSLFYTFLFLIQELTFPSIRSILTFPIFNNLMKELKKYSLDQIKTEQDSGKTTTKILKINYIRTAIDQIFITYKNLVTIITITISLYFEMNYKILILNIMCISIFFIFSYISQIKLLKIRKKAWNYTELAMQKIQESIENLENIKQNLIDQNDTKEMITQEAIKWEIFNFYSNLRSIGIASILVNLIWLNPHNIPLCYIYIIKLKSTEAHIKRLIQYCADFSFLTEETLKTNPEENIEAKLIIKNVKIYESGPFNFNMNKDVVIIKGNNGAGKTLLAKAIANLVSFEGEIITPKCIYIGVDSIIHATKSKGERIIEQINLAINKNYSLFILDEVLDLLSEKNLTKIFNQLQNKKIILITHKQITIDREYEEYFIKNNQIIKIN